MVRSPPSAPPAWRRLPSVPRRRSTVLDSTHPPAAKLRIGGQRGTRTRPRAAARHFHGVPVRTGGRTAGAEDFGAAPPRCAPGPAQAPHRAGRGVRAGAHGRRPVRRPAVDRRPEGRPPGRLPAPAAQGGRGQPVHRDPPGVPRCRGGPRRPGPRSAGAPRQ
jgi:hypothetical protein